MAYTIAMADDQSLQCFKGFCPICEKATAYEAHDPYFRSSLRCLTCDGGSVPRERAVALLLNETRPNWRELAIHESAPVERALYRKLKRECPRYVASHLFANEPRGITVHGYRNEDIEAQTFADAEFDIVLHIDVFEHIFDPAAAIQEIWRTLKQGGVMIAAFPMIPQMKDAVRRRANKRHDGEIEHLLGQPIFHGNPIDEAGSLVTMDYGYGLHQQIAEWAPFDVRIARYCNQSAGILGDFTDVTVAVKRET